MPKKLVWECLRTILFKATFAVECPTLPLILQVLNPFLLPSLPHLIQEVIGKLGIHIRDILGNSLGSKEPNCLEKKRKKKTKKQMEK